MCWRRIGWSWAKPNSEPLWANTHAPWRKGWELKASTAPTVALRTWTTKVLERSRWEMWAKRSSSAAEQPARCT